MSIQRNIPPVPGNIYFKMGFVDGDLAHPDYALIRLDEIESQSENDGFLQIVFKPRAYPVRAENAEETGSKGKSWLSRFLFR